jgi:hypothetical protein
MFHFKCDDQDQNDWFHACYQSPLEHLHASDAMHYFPNVASLHKRLWGW